MDENESDYVLNQNGEVTGYLGTDWKVLNIPAEIGNQTVTGIGTVRSKISGIFSR